MEKKNVMLLPFSSLLAKLRHLPVKMLARITPVEAKRYHADLIIPSAYGLA